MKPQPGRPNPYGYKPGADREEPFSGVLEGLAKFLFGGGALMVVLCVAGLIVTYSLFGNGNPPGPAEQGLRNVGLMSNLLLVGVIALMVGSTFLFWGEEILAPIQLIIAAILYFSPLVIPTALPASTPSEVSGLALTAIQNSGGGVMGILAIGVLIADVITRVRERAKQGARADQLKYGKGIKEEKDIQNVFLGKCWQLPFCRKFVREKCPIYHSKRTCWKERVGCMCEEEVIRNALANKPIPKDSLAAAKFIPYNNRLPLEAKKERCRQCVIYNEHLKHKYKLYLGLTLTGFVGGYALFRPSLLAATQGMIDNVDRIITSITFRSGTVSEAIQRSPLPFAEILLVSMTFVALAYALKGLEFICFKLKL